MKEQRKGTAQIKGGKEKNTYTDRKKQQDRRGGCSKLNTCTKRKQAGGKSDFEKRNRLKALALTDSR